MKWPRLRSRIFQPQVHLWLVNAQNLANLSQPLTFCRKKIVQQLKASD